MLGGGATKGFLIKLLPADPPSPAGLDGAGGGAEDLLKAFILSRNDPETGFSVTAGGGPFPAIVGAGFGSLLADGNGGCEAFADVCGGGGIAAGSC